MGRGSKNPGMEGSRGRSTDRGMASWRGWEVQKNRRVGGSKGQRVEGWKGQRVEESKDGRVKEGGRSRRFVRSKARSMGGSTDGKIEGFKGRRWEGSNAGRVVGWKDRRVKSRRIEGLMERVSKDGRVGRPKCRRSEVQQGGRKMKGRRCPCVEGSKAEKLEGSTVENGRSVERLGRWSCRWAQGPMDRRIESLKGRICRAIG